ncbi:hypothetical protein Q5A_008825 [Serratia inhibens PRI-2C]|nr:hypothetical protein Q5A_008825 [Serratia inhibens PRI-2C]
MLPPIAFPCCKEPKAHQVRFLNCKMAFLSTRLADTQKNCGHSDKRPARSSGQLWMH